MTRRDVRIIPRGHDLDTQLTRKAVDRGWQIEKAVAKDETRGTPGELAFSVRDSGTWVSLQDDPFAGLKFISIVGPDQERLAHEIRRDFHSWTDPELFAWWDKAVADDDAEDRVDAAIALGVNAPAQPNEEYSKRLRQAIRDKNGDVRDAGAIGIAYAGDREFREDLARIAANDPHEPARKRAKYVLDRWAREDGG